MTVDKRGVLYLSSYIPTHIACSGYAVDRYEVKEPKKIKERNEATHFPQLKKEEEKRKKRGKRGAGA